MPPLSAKSPGCCTASEAVVRKTMLRKATGSLGGWGGNCRAPERTACRGEFGPGEANRRNLKSVSLRTREAQTKFQKAKNARRGFYLQKGNKGSPWGF